jgi:cytochrome c-type biogenesis protein CcmF
VVFAFAIAALLGKQLDSSWARWSRPWTTMAWVFLTLGIALGSWWAYYELGWGGWWFWDPVENASFMPWLAGTALIHSMAATEKRGVFKNWTVLLAICAFSLSLLGTFLVRSGVLTSVHAFASDPARGVFILILLTIVIGGSLLLYAIRAPGTLKGGHFEMFSRERFLLVNSVLLSVALATVLLGTLYPLIVEAMGMGKLSVGAPYFNAVFIPLMAPVTVVMGLGMITRWRTDNFIRVLEKVKYIALGSILIGAASIVMLAESVKIQTILGVTLSVWIVWSTLYAVHERLQHQKNKWLGIYKLPSAFIGMCLAHIGFAMTITGVCLTSHYSVEVHERMGEGDSVPLAGYVFTLDELRDLQGPNYNGMEAIFDISKHGKSVASLNSQKRIYTVRNMPMTEAGIDAGLFRDIYVSMGEPLDNDDWSVRLYYRPFVRWLWLGAIFMGLGGAFAAFDKRYRIKARHSSSVTTSATGAESKATS